MLTCFFPSDTEKKKNNTEPECLEAKKTERKKGSVLARFLCSSLLICQMIACTTTTTDLPTGKKPAVDLPESLSFLTYSTEDRKLFDEGLARLETTPERPADYAGSAKIFEMLVQKYPDSKWRRQAELWLEHLNALARLEEKLKTCQRTVEDSQTAQGRLQRENEQLQRDIRKLSEKNLEELKRVNAENEQFKRDIRLLKNMDLQRENRERMLR